MFVGLPNLMHEHIELRTDLRSVFTRANCLLATCRSLFTRAIRSLAEGHCVFTRVPRVLARTEERYRWQLRGEGTYVGLFSRVIVPGGGTSPSRTGTPWIVELAGIMRRAA
jgi:hypothetical protein